MTNSILNGVLLIAILDLLSKLAGLPTHVLAAFTQHLEKKDYLLLELAGFTQH